jgi:hypothetical protein
MINFRPAHAIAFYAIKEKLARTSCDHLKKRIHLVCEAWGDAEYSHVLWRASAAVRRGAKQNQGLITIDLVKNVSGFIESVLP